MILPITDAVFSAEIAVASEVSTGVVILVSAAIFVVVTVIAAFCAYKVKLKKLREQRSDDEKKERGENG